MPAAPRAAQTPASAPTSAPPSAAPTAPTARRRAVRARSLAPGRAPTPAPPPAPLPPPPSRARLTLRALLVGALLRGPAPITPATAHRFLEQSTDPESETTAALDAVGGAVEAAAALDADLSLDLDAVVALFEQTRAAYALLAPARYRASQLTREAVALDACADLLAAEPR